VLGHEARRDLGAQLVELAGAVAGLPEEHDPGIPHERQDVVDHVRAVPGTPPPMGGRRYRPEGP
jgi:hypothetical protein